MVINRQEIQKLESDLNKKLLEYNTEFIMTIHFSIDRLNDVRNNPPITLQELNNIFNILINKHITAIVALNDKETFNIRCTKSHINMPCAVVKETKRNGTLSHKNIIITVMRKEKFIAKDPIEFKV
jgi:hypothetical protein